MSTLANRSGRTESARILIYDVNFYTGGYLVFEIEKTANRKFIGKNYIEINPEASLRKEFSLPRFQPLGEYRA